jgi:MFS family permease
MNKKAFWVLVGSMLISMLGMGVVSPFLPIYANTMGASSLEIGLVQAGFNITGIGTLLFIGRLSDRHGRKSFLSAGLFILAVSAIGLMYSTDPVHLIFWRFVQGLGASSHMPIAQAYLGDITPEGSEGRWMGYFNAVLFSGMGLGPLVGGVISDAYSIRTTFLIMAILNILAVIATLLFLKEMPRKTASRGNTGFLSSLKSRTMRGACSYCMTTGVGVATLMAFMPLFADVKIGLSATLIGVLLAARTPVSLLQSYTGRLADRCNRRSMVLWGGSLAAISVFVLPATTVFWTLVLAYISVAVGQSVGMPAANAYVVQEGRAYGMGASMTTFMLAMNVGNGIGPVVLGVIADWFGLESAFHAAAICMALGMVAFAFMVKGDGARGRGDAEKKAELAAAR